MTARRLAVEAGALRLDGAAAWDRRARLMGCPASIDWRRRAWIEGYLMAVDDSVRALPENALVAFPVEPPRCEAAWTPVEDLALSIARRLGLPDRVTARLVARSPLAVRIRAQRLGLARPWPRRVAACRIERAAA